MNDVSKGHALASSRPAIDAPRQRRPGVPAKMMPPKPVGSAHWTTPDLQPPRDDVTRDAQRSGPTATFGTGQPPRGLSGTLRRAAYRIPDYDVRRWLLLMSADKVDALEWQLGALVKNPAAWAIAAVAIGSGVVVLGRRRRPFVFAR